MRVDNNTGKGTSGMDKFSSKVHRVHTLEGICKLFILSDQYYKSFLIHTSFPPAACLCLQVRGVPALMYYGNIVWK